MEVGWWRDPAHIRKCALGEASIRARTRRREDRTFARKAIAAGVLVSFLLLGLLLGLAQLLDHAFSAHPELMRVAPRDERCGYAERAAALAEPPPPAPTPSITWSRTSLAECTTCGRFYQTDMVHVLNLPSGGRATFTGCAHCVGESIAATSSLRRCR